MTCIPSSKLWHKHCLSAITLGMPASHIMSVSFICSCTDHTTLVAIPTILNNVWHVYFFCLFSHDLVAYIKYLMYIYTYWNYDWGQKATWSVRHNSQLPHDCFYLEQNNHGQYANIVSNRPGAKLPPPPPPMVFFSLFFFFFFFFFFGGGGGFQVSLFFSWR